MYKEFNFKENCFDVLRIIAITIVMLSHSFRWFGIEKPSWLIFFTDGSIGVSMFFAMSGFLIMGAYNRAIQNGSSYILFIWNRILRLYPSIISSAVFVSVYLLVYKNMNIFSFTYVKFIIGYLFLGRWGALWAIPVTILFYLISPLVYYTFKNVKPLSGMLIILFFWQFNLWDKQLINYLQHIPFIGKYIDITFFLCFLYEFFIGCFLFFNYKVIQIVKERKIWIFIWILFLLWYVVYSYTDLIAPFGEMHNAINGFIVSLTTIFTGFLFIKRLKLDISYGLFIYHMVVINYLLANGVKGFIGLFLTFVVTLILAFISALTVEKKFLGYKK